MTTTQQKARDIFTAYDAALTASDYGRGPVPNPADFGGYRHGWIVVDGVSFNRDSAFPEIKFPRFPADQGLSD